MSKFIRSLIYLLIFLIPWQTRLILRPGILNGGNWEYGIVGVYATEILLWLICLFFVLNGGLKSWIFSKKSKIIFLVFLIFSLINFFIAPDKIIFVQQWVHIIEAIVLVWLIKKNKINRLCLFWVFISGLIIQALLGIYQFLFQTTFASRWLGLTSHNPGLAGSSVLENWDGRWLRAYGGMTHPNMLGGYLAIGILLVLIFLAFYLNNKIQRLLALASLGILTLALFFTFSRSAWLALVIGLIIAVISVWQAGKEKIRKIFPALVLLIVLFSILIFIFQPLVFGRVTGEGRLESQSTTERLSGYGEAGALLKKNFFFGVGLGSYTLAFHNQKDAGREAWNYQPVHNVLLLSLVEVGVLGFLIILWLMKYFYRQSDWLWLTLLPLIFLDHYLWSSMSGLILFSLIYLLLTKVSKFTIIRR